jgi:3-oxoadipate enol-lactonase
VSARRAVAGAGRAVAYDVVGEADGAPPVVLLHAVGLDRTVWDGWTDPLAAAGHRVIAVDLPGHGASDPEPGAPSLSGMAAAVAVVLAAEGVASAHLLGVSMGGMVAQTLAIAQPTLAASLVLCCTMATIPDHIRPAIRQRGADARAGGMAAVAEPTIDRWISPAGRDDAPARRIREILLADDVDVFAGCWDAIATLDTVGGLAGLADSDGANFDGGDFGGADFDGAHFGGAVPALVVEGGADISLPPGSGERLAAALPGSELVTIPGAWHLGPYEDPAPFLDAVQPFLSRVLRSSRITLRADGAGTSMPQTKACPGTTSHRARRSGGRRNE